jgi:hypothetical protein
VKSAASAGISSASVRTPAQKDFRIMMFLP